MQDRIFYSISLGLLLGVLARSFILLNWYVIVLVAIVSTAIFFLTFIFNNKPALFFSIFLLALSLGIIRFDQNEKKLLYAFDNDLNKTVSFEARIIDEPEYRENTQKVLIETLKEEKPIKILVTSPLSSEFKYGDEVSFTGKLRTPENFITDSGKEFDYVNYLRKDGILYLSDFPNMSVVSEGNGNKIKSLLYKTKEKFLEKINNSIRTPESLLMGGLILGEKASFGEDLRQNFVDTGTIHIVALSGYNVTIVAEWFMGLFSFLPFNFAIMAGIIAVFFFVLMTGASSTAIRAGIMASLALVARLTGRSYDVGRALIIAAIVMVCINPFILVFDASFQLSFIATVAVIFLAPRIEKYFFWIPSRWKLRETFVLTISAYIFVMPFILYKMGNLSLVALPTNILILPFIPLTMILGFLTGLSGLISTVIAFPFGCLSYIFLHYELFTIGFFSSLPFAALTIANFPLWLTVLIYLIFIYKLFGRSVKGFILQQENSAQ